MANGKNLNKDFLKEIDEQRDKLLEAGQAESTLTGNVIDVSGNNTDFIKVDDEDKYKAVNDLKNFLEFSTFTPSETFEIPGVKVPSKSEPVTLYIKREDITKIADRADEYEKLLGVTFTDQIYQFQTRYKKIKIKGKTENIEVPRPKLMSETPEQYEKYLEEAYTKCGEPPVLTDDNMVRQPYKHETIDFGQKNQSQDGYISEYYRIYQENERKKKMPGAQKNKGGKRNNRINDNDEYTVKDSELAEKTPLGQKLGATLTSFENFFKSESTWKKVRLAAVGALLASGGTYLVFANPVGALAVGGFVGMGIALGKAGKKLGAWLKRKKDDILYGPKLEDEEEEPEKRQPTPQPNPPQQPQNQPTPSASQPPKSPTQPQGQGGQNQQTPPVAPPNPPQPPQQPASQNIVNSEELESFLEEAGINVQQHHEIEARIRIVENELSQLPVNSPEYTAKKDELLALKKIQREQLEIIEGLLNDLLNGIRQNKSGGRSL